MDSDNMIPIVRSALGSVPWDTVLLFAAPATVLSVILFALLSKRRDRRMAAIATTIGLIWMAQGMYDSAVHTYQLPNLLAGTVFGLFETFMIARMLHANRYRHDPDRRAKSVQFVWSLSMIAGLVVAFAEGLAQMPLRFTVPLLVAWNWYLDLTADDDPADRQVTSWRWTPRRIGLALGLIEPGKRDVETVDKDRLVARMTALRFNLDSGPEWLNTALRRRKRLNRMGLSSDLGMLTEMRVRIGLAKAVLDAPAILPAAEGAPRPLPAPRVAKELHVEHLPVRRPQGVHVRDGRELRGADLESDAVLLMRDSISATQPRGMSTAELRGHYDPPLGQRKAEEFAAKARRAEDGVNGHKVV